MARQEAALILEDQQLEGGEGQEGNAVVESGNRLDNGTDGSEWDEMTVRETSTTERTSIITECGIPTCDVMVGGVSTRVVWDACATKSFMCARWAKVHNLPTRDLGAWSSVRTVTGPSLQRVRMVDTTLTISDGVSHRTVSVTFQLLDNWDNSARAILGKPLLNMLARKAAFTLDLATNTLALSTEKGERFSVVADKGTPLVVEVQPATNEEILMLTEVGSLPAEADHPEAEVLRTEFADVFSGEFTGPKTPLPLEAVIEFKDGHPPPVNRPWFYDFSAEERAFLEPKLQEMEESEYIEACPDPALFATMFTVPKPASEPGARAFRVVLDMRVLNNASVPRSFQPERITDILHHVAGYKYVTVLDVSDAFFKLSLAQSSRKYAAFYTPSGRVMQFKTLPMGFHNSPFYWQAALAQILAETREFTRVFMDDIAIFSNDLADHLEKVRRVLDILRRYQLKVSGKKAQLARTRGIRFLGHELGDGMVQPRVDKDVIRAWRPPSNKKEAKGFIGLFCYYREFIPRASELSQGMDAVTGSKVKFHWGEAQEASFQAMKAAILACEGLTAFSYDPSVKTRLLSDASAIAVGGALEQLRPDGRWATVGLFSKRLPPTKSMRSAIYREAYGVLLNLRHFRRLLKHREFVLYVDCKPLLLALQGSAPQDARWQQILGELLSFRVTIALVRGRDNVLADQCSRYDWAPVEPEESERFTIEGEEVFATDTAAFEISDEEWQKAYKDDARCARILQVLSAAPQPHSYFLEKYVLRDGLLYLRARDEAERERLVVPEGLVGVFLQQYHDGSLFGGHGGVTATYMSLRARFYFHRMFDWVRRYVRGCRQCARAKAGKNMMQEVHPLPIPHKLFEGISLDFLSGFPKVKFARGGVLEDCDCVLTVTCLLSRMVCLVPVASTITGEQCVEVLMEEVFIGANWGLPAYIVSDSDPRFRSSQYRDSFAALKVELYMSTSRHPQTDGATEVKNRQILDILRSYCVAEPQKWAHRLKYVAWNMNRAVSRSTGLAPLQVAFGQMPRMEWPTRTADGRASLPARLDAVCIRREVALAAAFDNLTAARDDYVITEEPARPPQNLKVDDWVYVNTEALLPTEFKGAKHKIVPRFCGPFQILKCSGSGAYLLDLPVTSRAKRTVNVAFLKKFTPSGMKHPLQRDIPQTALGPGEFETEAIVSHHKTRDSIVFQVKWFGFEETTVEPLCMFTDGKGRVINEHLKRYVAENKIELPADRGLGK